MIFTGHGDKGKTRDVSGNEVYKDNIEIEVYGVIDELLAYLGYAYSKINKDNVKRDLKIIMNDLHNLIPDISSYKGRISNKRIEWLEEKIKEYSRILKPMNTFLLEVSSESTSIINIARVICRKTERRVVTLSKIRPINNNILAYLNRLSDLLFVLYRYMNAIEEVPEIEYEKYENEEIKKN